MNPLLRRLFLALVFALSLSACPGVDPGGNGDGPSADDAGAGSPVTLKIMDWNVHDFFDETPGPALQASVFTTAQVNAKIAALAKVIKAVNPDVLTLQEVENQGLLTRLNAALAPLSLPNFALIPTNIDPRGINVALMTRFPILQVTSHQNESFLVPQSAANCPYGSSYRYSRDALEVLLDLGGGRTAVVFIGHQISQLDATRDCQRLAQSQHTRDLAEARLRADPFRPVFITGDMNQDIASAATSLYFADGQFVDVGLHAATTGRWTYCTGSNSATCSGGTKERFDYIIPDKSTAASAGSVTFIHGTDVGAASDHEPVSTTFTIP